MRARAIHGRRLGTIRPVLAALFLLGVVAGCGDGDDGGGDDSADESLEPPFINFHEYDFAQHPRWRAAADDVLLVDLEPPGSSLNHIDTGTIGVDEIPVVYFGPAERTYCWDGDRYSNDGDRVPHSLTLLDDQRAELLRLEENEACVTREVPAGNYTMVFTHGEGGADESDTLFVIPGGRGPSAEFSESLPPQDVGERRPIDEPAAPPSCPVRSALVDPVQRPGEVATGRTVIDRGMNSWGPVQYLGGPCEDVRLITNGIAPDFPDGTWFVFAFMPADTFVRVYRDPYFRGPRIPIKVLGVDYRSFARFVLPPEPFEFPEFLGYIGSAMPEIGLPASNKETLISTNHCDHCNLQSVDLHGRNLAGVSIRQANLSHAELGGTIMNNVQAAGALFQSAHLKEAKFLGANLDGASFESAGPIPFEAGQDYPAADLTLAKLNDASLLRAHMRGAMLGQADFTKAHLDGADLGDSMLSKADFTDATMNDVTLTRASGIDVILTRAKMSTANLQGAILNGARMEGAVLSKAVLGRDAERHLEACQLSDAYMANVDLSSAEATGVNLRKARFYGRMADANNATLTNADMVDAELSGTNFTRASLQNANLGGAKCVNCKFNNARMAATSVTTMDGAKFSGTHLEGADFSQATVSGCVFTDAIVSFTTGNYSSVAVVGELSYTAVFGPSQMGEVTTSSEVFCPDGLRGPCNTQQRLSPRGGTPTRVPTRTAAPTWTPGGVDPFSTPTPRAS